MAGALSLPQSLPGRRQGLKTGWLRRLWACLAENTHGFSPLPLVTLLSRDCQRLVCECTRQSRIYVGVNLGNGGESKEVNLQIPDSCVLLYATEMVGFKTAIGLLWVFFEGSKAIGDDWGCSPVDIFVPVQFNTGG